MMRRFLLCAFLLFLVTAAYAGERDYDRGDDNSAWSYGSDEGGGGSAYLGVDIADVTSDRLSELKLKEEHGAEITMVDQDAPAGKAGLHEHDVILSLNGTAVDSAAQLRRMIKETPPGRVVALGISRDGQASTIKVQLADRKKTMNWQMPDMPKVPNGLASPDFDNLPVSVVVVTQSARSGLAVENLTPQLGDFFGVKDGKGVLVRSVEKGSRGEKAGFRAGDVVVKVNSHPVHDTSDFTHALRSSSGNTAAVTVVREKREQNLTLPLPERKDSGSLMEDSFDMEDIEAETQEAMDLAGDEMARLKPMIEERMRQAMDWQDMQNKMEGEMLQRQRDLEKQQKEWQHWQQEFHLGLPGDKAEI